MTSKNNFLEKVPLVVKEGTFGSLDNKTHHFQSDGTAALHTVILLTGYVSTASLTAVDQKNNSEILPRVSETCKNPLIL